MQDSPNCGDQLSGWAFLGRRWRRQADVWWGRSTSTAPQSSPGTLWKPGVGYLCCSPLQRGVSGGEGQAGGLRITDQSQHVSLSWILGFPQVLPPPSFWSLLKSNFPWNARDSFWFSHRMLTHVLLKKDDSLSISWVHFVRIYLLGSVQERGGMGLSSSGKQVPLWGAPVLHPAQAKPGVLPQVCLLMKPDSQCPFRGLQPQLNDQVGKEDSVGVRAQTTLSPRLLAAPEDTVMASSFVLCCEMCKFCYTISLRLLPGIKLP